MLVRPSLLLLPLLLLPLRFALATEVPAEIAADVTWTLAESPMEVVVNAWLLPGVVLTIEPGVVVEFAEDTNLFIGGELIAAGTADQPIELRSAEPDERWGSVIFEPDAERALFEGVGEYSSGSLIEYVSFTGARRALQLRGGPPYIHACSFVDNHCECGGGNEGGAAIYIAPGLTPRIRDSLFDGNEVGGQAWGGAIHADQANPILQDNTFTGNAGPYGAAVCGSNMYSPIVGNTFTGNDSNFEGAALTLYSSSPAVLNNTITDNDAVLDGGGVHVCVDCRPHANPVVLDNTITGNTAVAVGAGGFGAAYVRLFRSNNLHGNTRAGQPSDFGWFNDKLDVFPAWVHSPDISGNWWGTTDRASIEAAIHDAADEEGLGRVTWEPPLEQAVDAPETRVALTTTRLRYTADGDPIPALLTLYNPGPERQVDLLLLVQYGAGARLVHDGGFWFPGAERVGDAWRITLPENSVWFETLMDPPFTEAAAALAYATWHAALLEPASGARIGDVCSTRLDLGGEPEPEERR
jgi:hypothetical protein